VKAAKSRKPVSFTYLTDARDSGGNAVSATGTGRLR
jgi:hypothetical protein